MPFKLVFGLLLLSLVGCSTTITSGNVADPERALENYIQLGRNYLSDGQRDQARFNLLKALEIDDRSPDANNVMALLYETEGEIELAKQHYQRALSSDRSYSPARMNFARVLYAQEEFGDALNQYQLVAEDVSYRLRPDAFVGVGMSALRLGDTDGAKDALRRALQLNPNIGWALLEVAEIAYQEREYPLSLEYLEQYERSTVETPRSLVLGIQLSRIFNDANKEQDYSLALRSRFPDSMEARQHQLDQ